MSEANDLTPRRAASRYLDSRRPEVSDGTYSTYKYRLKLFVEWCERKGIQRVGDLNGWQIDEFRSYRAGMGVSPNTLHNEFDTLNLFAEYLDRIGATDELGESVDVPTVSKEDRARETKLEPDRAEKLLQSYRSSDEEYGSRFHTVLEIAWHTGARVGAIRALDLQDFNPGEDYLSFHHRPETGTPLKKKFEGERPTGIHPEVTRAIQSYIGHHRPDGHDEYGRQPLFVTVHGTRPSASAFRAWMYQATFPCRFFDCPHGHDPATCEFKTYATSSKCPSSRAPHHVRTGSLTWQRDRGVPRDVLQDRANASEETIEEYYDQATKRQRMERRRREHIDKLGIDDNESESND